MKYTWIRKDKEWWNVELSAWWKQFRFGVWWDTWCDTTEVNIDFAFWNICITKVKNITPIQKRKKNKDV